MDRRKFLTATVKLSAAGAVAAVMPGAYEAKANHQQVRASTEGVIWALDMAGRWMPTLNFGPDLTIVRLWEAEGQFRVRLKLHHLLHFIDLQSVDGIRWRTMPDAAST
jgi:hypothetical protein